MRARGFAIVICMALSACDSSSDGSSEGPDTKDVDGGFDEAPHSGMEVLPADESYQDKTLEEWAIEYMRWSFAQTSCESAADDPDGSLCRLYQDPESPVFFLQRDSFDTAQPSRIDRTRCEIPGGKAILVPVAAFSNDNAGVRKPLSEDELRQSVSKSKESIRSLVFEADGEKIDLAGRDVGPVMFGYRVPAAPNAYSCNEQDGVEDVDVEPSFFAGYFALIAPPAPGSHRIEYASVFTYANFDFAFHVRTSFDITWTRD